MVTETQPDTRAKIILAVAAFILLSVTAIGLGSVATGPELIVPVALSYAAGLSMVLLPCTLPLVFVIVPMSMGKTWKKGLLMAVLFGLGLSVTLAIYGAVFAWLGQFIGVDRATRYAFALGGLAALAFGLMSLSSSTFLSLLRGVCLV